MPLRAHTSTYSNLKPTPVLTAQCHTRALMSPDKLISYETGASLLSSRKQFACPSSGGDHHCLTLSLSLSQITLAPSPTLRLSSQSVKNTE
eukprot:1161020-Pelagomonas_calceolata.AAC.1